MAIKAELMGFAMRSIALVVMLGAFPLTLTQTALSRRGEGL
jgi:hypothetical protein